MQDRGQNDNLKDWEALQNSRQNKQSHQQSFNSSNQLSSDNFNQGPENNKNEWNDFQTSGFNQPQPNKKDFNSNTSGNGQKSIINKDIFSSFDSNSSGGKGQFNSNNSNSFNMFEAFGFNQNPGNSGDLDNGVKKKWDAFDFNNIQQSNPQIHNSWNDGNWTKPNSIEFSNASVSFSSNPGVVQQQLIQKPPTNQSNSFNSISSQSSFNNQVAINANGFSSPNINSNNGNGSNNNFNTNNNQKNNIVQDDLLGLSSGPSKSTNTASILDVQF